jgi:hypothetical protein
MKNSKYLLLAAIAAATAMVSSCSDNDVLEGVKDTGIPFSVTASTNSGGSRGSDITSLSNFQLWGFGTDQTSHFDGNNFTPKAGSSTVFESSITPNWPNTNNCLFYGISNNTSDMLYGVTAGSPGINTTKAAIRNGSFDYTIPTDVADQEDLLVAAAQGNSANGVNMHFDHALTAAKLHLTLDPKLNETYYKPDQYHSVYIVKIKKIIIHNIKISGTYTFGAGTSVGASSWTAAENGSWNTSSGTLGDYVFDFTSNPLIYQVACDQTMDEVINIDGNNSSIYFIPQTISSFDIVANETDDAKKNNYKILSGEVSGGTTDSYVELQAIAGVYYNEEVKDYYENSMTDDDLTWYKEENKLPQDAVLTSDENGWYDDAGKTNMIIDKDGYIKDFSTPFVKNDMVCPQPTLETSLDGLSLWTSFADEDNYGTLFKTFKATLAVNGNRNIKIEIVNAARSNDGSGAFGVAVEASTGGAKKY